MEEPARCLLGVPAGGLARGSSCQGHGAPERQEGGVRRKSAGLASAFAFVLASRTVIR